MSPCSDIRFMHEWDWFPMFKSDGIEQTGSYEVTSRKADRDTVDFSGADHISLSTQSAVGLCLSRTRGWTKTMSTHTRSWIGDVDWDNRWLSQSVSTAIPMTGGLHRPLRGAWCVSNAEQRHASLNGESKL